MVRTLALGILFAAGLWQSDAWAASARVEIDRSPVAMNESFTATFIYDGELRGEPGFDVLLDDFEILAQNRRSSLQIINGVYGYELTWALTLIAKRSGDLLIPPVSFGTDLSAPVSVTVLPASTEPGAADIFFEVETEPAGEVYVQGQLLQTVRLLYEVEFSDAELGEPAATGVDVVIESLGEARRYEAQRGERRYRVYEQRYAIFPQQSGALTLEPIEFRGRVRRGGVGSRMKRVYSSPLEITVLPADPGFGPDGWLPAADVTVSSEWSIAATEVEAGTPVTLRIAVTADGLTASQLPALALPVPGTVKQYPDPETRNNAVTAAGTQGRWEQTVALVPTEPGLFRIPAIELPWWDARNRERKVARSAPLSLTVLPSKLPGSTPRETPGAFAREPAGGDRVSSTSTPSDRGIWPWVSTALALAWLLTALAWWRARSARVPRRRDSARKEKTPRDKPGRVERQLRIACRMSDGPAVARELGRWAQSTWQLAEPPPLLVIASRVDPELAEEIGKLHRALYRDGETWTGDALWAAFEHHRSAPTPGKEGVSVGSRLAPLAPG